MARSEHLPIYKASYDLCLYLEQIVRNFARYHKYSLGAHLRESALRVLRLVVRANSRIFSCREDSSCSWPPVG